MRNQKQKYEPTASNWWSVKLILSNKNTEKLKKYAIELVGAEFSHKDTICSMSVMFFNVHRENLLHEPSQCP